MPAQKPANDARIFEYWGSDRLYTDHLGRRVVADVEGSGTYAIEADCDLQVHVDEDLLDRRVRQSADASFSQSLTVLAAPGHVQTSVSQPSLNGSDLTLVDAFDIADAQALKERGFKVQNMSDIFPLESTFPDGSHFSGHVASHLNTATWTLNLEKLRQTFLSVEGLRIRKLYDRFHGRQRARVMVNGEPVGWWYDPTEDRVHRWAWSHFDYFGSLPTAELTIAIDPPAASPLWSISRYEVYAATVQ